MSSAPAAVPKGKHVGRVRALTTLSPVIPDHARLLDRRLRLVRWIPNAGRPLQELAFIHYGRWTVIRDLPDPSGSGGRRALKYRYLLFESNFDGGESDYLDAFADTVPHRLARLWGTCFRFERGVMDAHGADGREVAPWAFRQYVHDNELEVLHFYAAYPGETVISVRQAIDFDARWKRQDGRELQAAALGPVPDPTGRVGKALRIVRDWRSSAFKRYGVRPLSLIAPIVPERLDDVRRLCERYDGFTRLPQTHYARFVLIPPGLTDLGQPDPDRLETHYLLLTSNHSGGTDDYVARLSTEAEEIWDCCAGRPLPYETDYFVAGYEARTPEEIRQYAARRREAANGA
ncbi:MAG TPA: hypothetical protein VNO82_24395 [Solirubrobacteraceae bacterium]|nr:hypothetical protein [Solirubrobacteraceae bacterium]